MKRPATKNLQRLGYRRIVQLLVYLVIIPTVLLLFIGIVLMFLGEAKLNLIIGILTVSFVAVMVTGVILVLVFVRREANLSELQADFVSKVSHELKTPLTSIRLFTETMKERRLDEPVFKQCVEQVLEETDRLNQKIERLLDWGRMEAGRRVYDLHLESIEPLVREAVDIFGPLKHSAIDFECVIEPNLPDVLVDRYALTDAIANLLSNAMKYGGTPCKVSVLVRLLEDEVRIEVTDNGEGIAPTEQKRIFQKFYRIDDRLARAREGSGLGLSIVQHIVRAHHGHVALDSAVGKGSTFAICLPCPKSEVKR